MITNKYSEGTPLSTIYQPWIDKDFLYNILNSISHMSFLEGATETNEMIFCFSELLRYCTERSDNFPTLKEDLAHIEKYLYLQKIRLAHRLNYSIHLAEDAADFRIPSMVLFPLVENAIVHGIEPNIDGGALSIDVSLRLKSICIIIKDTGCGLNKDTFQAAMNNVDSEEYSSLKHIYDQLKLYYKQGFSLMLQSEKSKGTSIELNIPLLKDLAPL